MNSFFSPLGLSGDNPFSSRVSDFFVTEQAKAALARLTPILELGGIALLVGEPGMGKSTLLDHLLAERVDTNRFRVVRVDFTNLSAGSFLRQLVYALGERPKRSKADVVQQLLALCLCIPQWLLFAVDEAHHLGPEALEDVRLLLTILGQRKMLAVILAGHPELRDLLRSPLQQSLSQRVLLRCILRGWTLQETCRYLSERLGVMGASERFMDTPAMEALYHYAKGNPRVIAQTMTACLIHMVLEGQKSLDVDSFKRVLAGMEG